MVVVNVTIFAGRAWLHDFLLAIEARLTSEISDGAAIMALKASNLSTVTKI
jgi:hypothetical protein|tara:strand:- start:1292 stop:1444 length:153 start_codon:yes stop_codon:yes gene_type:complete